MPVDDHLTHLDEQGRARMVDVGAKPDSERVAVAGGTVHMQPETLRLIREGAIKKGDVLTVARVAGIMAAKRTAELIPLCHPIALSQIEVDIRLDESANAAQITATARTIGKTGVEMEALTAVSVAALTIYDMAKAVDRSMRLSDIRLLEKRGGVHGDYVAPKDAQP
jgi:cyclic pyranopterin phosphate synthase